MKRMVKDSEGMKEETLTLEQVIELAKEGCLEARQELIKEMPNSTLEERVKRLEMGVFGE